MTPIILPVLATEDVISPKPSVLLTIPPKIAFPAPPIPFPPKNDTVGPPQLVGVPQSGLLYGEVCGVIADNAFEIFANSKALSKISFTFALFFGPYPIVHSLTPWHLSAVWLQLKKFWIDFITSTDPRRKSTILNPGLANSKILLIPPKTESNPDDILSIIPFKKEPTNCSAVQTPKLTTSKTVDSIKSLSVSPRPLIIFAETHAIASCTAFNGETIASCAATPAKCAAIGFPVAARVAA